jgi:hypothetical protein
MNAEKNPNKMDQSLGESIKSEMRVPKNNT